MDPQVSKRFVNYLDTSLIAFLNGQSRDEIIDSLIHLLEEGKKLPSKESFRKAVFEREALASTGIGMGIAIPHAKLKEIPDFFVAIGILQKKGVDWGALDNIPVRLIFMIGGPEERQSEYLQILSQLTSILRREECRRLLLQSESRAEITKIFENT